MWPPSLREPFTRAHALSAGLTDGDLRGSRCRRVFTNVYVRAATEVTLTMRAKAALLLAPEGAVVARTTAAALWGGVVAESPEVHLTLRPGDRMRVDGIQAKVQRRLVMGRRFGIPLTSPAQTFLDMSGELTLVDLVVLGDSLVRA